MDKASASGAGDCGFESHQGRFFFFFPSFVFILYNFFFLNVTFLFRVTNLFEDPYLYF